MKKQLLVALAAALVIAQNAFAQQGMGKGGCRHIVRALRDDRPIHRKAIERCQMYASKTGDIHCQNLVDAVNAGDKISLDDQDYLACEASTKFGRYRNR